MKTTKLISCAILMILLFTVSFVNAQNAVNFNSTSDLTTLFNSDSSPVFTNISTGGIGNTGSVNVPSGSLDIWTNKTGYSISGAEAVYTISAYFLNADNSGYGGLGFTTVNQNESDINGSPLYGLGMGFHGGGGFFINNQAQTSVTWGGGDLTIGNWYKMILRVTAKGSNLYDMDFQIWNSDINGNIGSLREEQTLNDVTNTNVGAAGTLYAYLSATGSRVSKIDNFSFSYTPPFSSLATDYYRSIATGNWSNPSIWQSSNDNSTWGTATLAPTSAATSITIKSPNNVTIDGNNQTASTIVIESGATLTNSGSNTLLVSGYWTNNGGTFTPGTGTVNFNGITEQRIGGTSSTTFNNLSANNSDKVKLYRATTINGTLAIGNITSCQFWDGSNQLTSTGTLNLNAGQFVLGNSWPAFTNITIATNAIVWYLGSGQTVATTYQAGGITPTTVPYYNLYFNGSGNVTTVGTEALTISGNLFLGGSNTLALNTNNTDVNLSGGISGSGPVTSGSGTINIGGNWTHNGTFTCGTGTVNYNGTSGSSQTAAGLTYYNLTMNNAASITLGADATVNNTLTLTLGITNTNGHTLIVANNATGAVLRTNGHILGNLQRAIATNEGTQTYTFNVGMANGSYNPVVIAFTNVTVAGTLTAKVTSGQHATPGTPLNTAKDVNLYWTLTNAGVAFTSYAPTFTYNAGNIIGGATQSNFIVGKYVAAWTAPTPVINAGSGPYTTQVTGLTTFSDFVVGETNTHIALSDNSPQVTAASVIQGTSNVVLHQSVLAVTGADATLTGMTCTTAGNYIPTTDISNLKVWYSNSSTFNAGTATQLSSITPVAAGAQTFTSFTPQIINSGNTGYLYITANVVPGATSGRTISISALAPTDFTFNAGSKSGSTTSGGTQTFAPCIVTIPDANFKAALLANVSINTNADGEIQCSEATAYTGTLDVSSKSISNLTGIEAFTNITRLYCSRNSLTVLDISHNTALTHLLCQYNSLTGLNVSANTALIYLDCGTNSLTSLNVKNGNNTHFIVFSATINTGLTCIQVDNAAWSTTNWTSKDATASYSNTDCGADLTWTGTTNTVWSTPTNWNNGFVPSVSNNITIPDVTNNPVATNVTVGSGKVLTINPAGELTVSGTLTNNSTGGVVIQSDATGTGSLITGSAGGTGFASAQRWMTAGAWHIVSSPLSGQTVAGFLTANGNIATKDGGVRGMMDYNPGTNLWNSFFIDGADNGSLGAGRGFSMRVDASDAAVSFTGSLQVGSQPATTSASYWNCIGNPYTSAIGITSGSSSAANFLTVNSANLDPSYGAVYVWNKPDASNGLTGNYTVISNTAPEFNDVQQGQAFMVNAATSSFSFTSAMQIHSPGLALKSTKEVWPTIKLVATVGLQKSSTIIAFNYGMTKGLDVTYDAGLLKGATDLIIYSRLVEDNGIPFAIQALPTNEYSSLIIPVGIDFKTGGAVVFSAEAINLSADCQIILEDKLLKKFTDLSQNTYTVTIAANSSISDRFRIHTSYLTTGLNIGTGENIAGQLSAWAVRNTEIRVNGKVSKQAIATLYDIQGRVVLIKNLEEGILNVIETPNLRTGIYLLSVKDNNRVQGFKIPVSE